MKKKITKKLELKKETLRSLEVATLKEIVGATAFTCNGNGSCRFCLPSGGDVC